MSGIISVPDTKFKLTNIALGGLSCQSFLMNNYSTENYTGDTRCSGAGADSDDARGEYTRVIKTLEFL